MHESQRELLQLDELLTSSAASSGEHLRTAFDQERRLDAAGLSAALPGIFEMHLAVLSGSGAPLVAPVDGIFFRGRVWFGLPAQSLRAKLVRRDARVSASFNDPPRAFIVHGTAVEAQESESAVEEYGEVMRRLYVELYGGGWIDWFEGLDHSGSFTGHIEPRVMFAKA